MSAQPVARPVAPAAVTPRVRPVAADPSRPAAPSPARLAQLELAARLAEAPAMEGRWGPRRMIGAAVLGSALLWGAIAVAGAALLG